MPYYVKVKINQAIPKRYKGTAHGERLKKQYAEYPGRYIYSGGRKLKFTSRKSSAKKFSNREEAMKFAKSRSTKFIKLRAVK